jgi:hypothetical protein
MLSEVSSRLFGKATFTVPGTPVWAGGQALVWADAAQFFAARIQTRMDWQECEWAGFPNRKSDMSAAASEALRKVLGQLEAGLRLSSNREKVANDITNPEPATQLALQRVAQKHAASVNKMIIAVGARLLGNGVSAPSPDEAVAWAQACTYLAGRIQASRDDCPGRKPDMSPNAARALRKVLAQFEAGAKLTSNREKVINDITNAGPTAIGGGQLTQLNLKRVDGKSKAAVGAMMTEMCTRLFGNKKSEPSTPEEAQVWTQAAIFFNGRIQAKDDECPGRGADMSKDAAAAIRYMLARISNQTKTSSASAGGLCTALGQI